MANGDFLATCPKNPCRENCGLAAADWLRREGLIFIDFDPPDEFEILAQSEGEVLGVSWDEERTGKAHELVERSGLPFPVARFVCRSCTRKISVEFGPFN